MLGVSTKNCFGNDYQERAGCSRELRVRIGRDGDPNLRVGITGAKQEQGGKEKTGAAFDDCFHGRIIRGTMTAKEMEFVRELVTRLGQFAADRRAFITVLEELKAPNWQHRLDELRQTPQYQLIAKRYELLARQMEVDADFEALAHKLLQINEGKPPN